MPAFHREILTHREGRCDFEDAALDLSSAEPRPQIADEFTISDAGAIVRPDASRLRQRRSATLNDASFMLASTGCGCR
jgi:hypothetical protein